MHLTVERVQFRRVTTLHQLYFNFLTREKKEEKESFFALDDDDDKRFLQLVKKWGDFVLDVPKAETTSPERHKWNLSTRGKNHLSL